MTYTHSVDLRARAARFLRSDNGSEFVSHAIFAWLTGSSIETAHIDADKLLQNSFGATFRDECLSLQWFRSQTETRLVIETWRRHYNHVRGHQSLVLEHQGEHDSQWAAIESIAGKIGCAAETLRGWVRQAVRDQGKRAGLTSAERDRLRDGCSCARLPLVSGFVSPGDVRTFSWYR